VKLTVAALVLMFCGTAWAVDYPPAQSPAVPDGTGYVQIPGAEIPIDVSHVYKVIIDGQTAADKPGNLLPALSRASLIVNALSVGHVPMANRKVVVIFHGGAVEGLLKNEGYRAKFGVDNPNLKALAELANAGVAVFVCGQHMANHKLGIDELAPQVKLATAASLVLITFQNEGYATLNDR
jgi:intracellular sulfur oxidation DsrE/DsrF family protein